MEKITCIVITKRNRFKEARRRRNRRRLLAAAQAVKEMAVYALILAILLFFGAGLGVTALILTDRMGMSLVVAVMGVFLVSGLLSEAIPRVFFRDDR